MSICMAVEGRNIEKRMGSNNIEANSTGAECLASKLKPNRSISLDPMI